MNRIVASLMVGVLLLLAGCGETTIYTGPEVDLGPVSIALTVDSKGNVVLSGDYTHSIPATKTVGVGWTVGFQTVLRQAEQLPHQLFIVWEDESGTVRMQQYDIAKPFKVTFSSDEWVREIKHEGNGSIVVGVEIRPDNETVSQDEPQPRPQPVDDDPQPQKTCQIEIDRAFQSIQDVNWTALGCPSARAASVWMGKEGFEGGQMLWREDRQEIYVRYSSGGWSAHDDTWREGQPEFSCPERGTTSPPVPKRGFGKVWCSNAKVRNGLGQAQSEEQGFTGIIQDMANGGHLIKTDTGRIIVLYPNGQWVVP